jgi:TatD DNase family protein
MSTFLDTHAHIYHEDFSVDMASVVSRFQEAGVKKVFMPNVDSSSIEAMLEMERRYSGICYPMMGLHPCSVTKGFEKELNTVEKWLASRPFIAVGEIGIDLYWDKTFYDHQCEAFSAQLDWAVKYRLPVVIHCRESMNETIEIVAKKQNGELRGVFHCFTGSTDQARRVIDLGFYIGIGGVATFKNGGLDKILPQLDLSRMVLETDSPYLSPVPYRGKRNEPSYIPIIAQRVADIMQCSVETVAELTTGNALALFNTVEA